MENGVGEAKEPAEVLAVVMAQISGYTELPKERSLLGQAEGYVTLGICTPKGRGFPSPGALIGSIRRITDEQTASAVGKVELFDDVEDAGFEAAFDVPTKIAESVVAAAKEHGVPVSTADKHFYSRHDMMQLSSVMVTCRCQDRRIKISALGYQKVDDLSWWEQWRSGQRTWRLWQTWPVWWWWGLW